mgnify:CR=1 FL=1
MSVAASLFLAVASGLFVLVWDFMDADRIAQLGQTSNTLVFQLSRNSRLYFLPHGSGISTGHVAPMAL